jgi:outer membrane receptor protein involved in Fe transport
MTGHGTFVISIHKKIKVMKIVKLILLLISIATLAPQAKSEVVKWTLKGQLIESSNQTPIAYATIVLNQRVDSSLVSGAITDDEGNFVIDKVVQGDYFIQISFIGFEDQFINHIAFDENSRVIDFGIITMQPSATVLAEVEVTGKSSPISSSLDKQILHVDKNLSSVGGTAADALKLSPSVKVDSDGNVLLRGSSEFIVLIDGRPTSMSAKEILGQTPANQISKIEVMTNPSVKYSAEGGAGIVNIILKKGAKLGFSSAMNATIGTKDKYTGDISFNLNREKISISASADLRDYTTTAINNYYRTLVKDDHTHYAFMGQDRTFREDNLGFRFGLNYTPSDKSTLNYSIHAGHNALKADIMAKTSGYSIPAISESYSVNTYDLLQNPKFYTNNLNYTRTLNDRGSSISLNGFYSYIDYYLQTKQDRSNADKNYVINDPNPYLQDILNDNYSHDVKLDADLVSNISEKSSLESGISYRSYSRFLDVTYAQFNYEKNKWQPHVDYTNMYDYKEEVYAGYANFNHAFGDIQVAAGIRVEYMDRLLKQRTADVNYAFDQLNIFPSLSISKSFDEVHQLQLSFSNRINRPDEYAMNPFPEFEDDYFYSEGNPNLLPEIVRSAELGYKHIGDKTVISSALFLRTTSDKIEQKLTIGDEDKIHTIYHNDAKGRNIGMEFMVQSQISDWWSVNVGTELSHYHISGNVDLDPFSRQEIQGSLQMVNSIEIKKSTSLQLIAYYNSKTVRSQGELSDYYGVDAAISHSFMEGKFSLNLQVKDIFQSLNYTLKTETGNMNLTGDFINESPIVLLSLGYRMSDYKKRTKDVQTKFDM